MPAATKAEVESSSSSMNEKESKSTAIPDEKPQELASLTDLFSFAQSPKTKLFIGLAFFFAVGSGCVFPALCFYFANAFEELSAATDADDFMSSIREVAYTFMVLGAIVLTTMTAQATFMETAAGEMTYNFKTGWFEALLRQDMAYYDILDVSGEGSVISTAGARYRKGVGRKMAEAAQFTVQFLGGLAYAFYASWATSLAVLTVTPLMYATALFLIKMNTTQTARANKSYAKAGSIVSTAIRSIRTVLSLNAVERMIDLYKEATQEAYDGAVTTFWLLGLANGSNYFVFLLTYIIVTLFGTWLLYDNVEESGCDPSGTVSGNDRCDPAGLDIFGALMGVSFSAAVLPQISVAIEALSGARVACHQAMQVMNRKVGSPKDPSSDQSPELPDYVIDSSSTTGKIPEKVVGEIEFHNVRFAYPARKDAQVFKGVSLRIEAGKTVALVGPSGSGKSSAVQLMERFYDPLGGSISLDGVDIKSVNIEWLRQQIGLVFQEPKLFAMSIRDNIASGCPGVSEEDIVAAAKKANAHSFITSFPEGYNTQVGDQGAQLSGGQKQRIAIARALIKKPKILLLDEATSALDSESEKTVQDALDDLMKLENMTTFVIAHRLSTIKNADMIAVVDNGVIAETGTHSELLAKKAHYFRLVEAQKGSYSSEANSKNETPSSTEHGKSEPSYHSNDSADTDAVVRFKDVYFEYPTRPDNPIFTGLNLNVRPGETLALVGSSGSGKSSAIQLLECFYRPSKGAIEYNGTDMEELNVKWLRDEFGLVSQEPVLFDTSIIENIRYSCPGATREKVIEAARKANAHNFIMEFPDQYETRVGPGSSLLSGGQKQRVAIARALVKEPKVLLLDEATSALDSESEHIVQQALDSIMFGRDQTCIVIAHRLSTIRNADRIAVIGHGKVREIGTHDELMANPDSQYRRLQEMQDLGSSGLGEDDTVSHLHIKKDHDRSSKPSADRAQKDKGKTGDDSTEVDEKEVAAFGKRARSMAKEDTIFFLYGGIGALFAGLMFPGWGILFAYMIDLLYTRVETCEGDDCPDIWRVAAEDLKEKSFNITYGYLGLVVTTLVGFTLLFWGFGVASERMNKRVRDSAFTSLLRQEVAWFDVRPPGALASQLADDAALLHAFCGEPIRTLTLNLSSVLVGIVVAFIYMWPFALLTLGILPFMGFGAEMEMRMYMGEDEGDDEEIDEHSPGGIVIETLANIRTVASLTLEKTRAAEYGHALRDEDKHPVWNNMIKGSGSGVGQFVQMWGLGMMFWWGGWLLNKFPNDFTYLDFNISMWSIFMGLYGLSIAAQGAVNREKAKLAAHRIFQLIDRQSLIDPLSNDGVRDSPMNV